MNGLSPSLKVLHRQRHVHGRETGSDGSGGDVCKREDKPRLTWEARGMSGGPGLTTSSARHKDERQKTCTRHY